MSAPRLTGERSMRANLRIVPPSIKSPPGLKAYSRLGRKWGCKDETAKDRIYGERGCYQMTADANEAFLAEGLTERVMTLMSPIDASLFTELPSFEECLHQHNHADAAEDLAQAEFVRTKSDAELGEWIRKLADEANALDKMLASAVRERERRKAAK